jgi:periplasmic protein TonB
MTNAVLYEELDQAVEKILTGAPPHSDEVDPLVAELLPIADDLLLAPRPEFRAALLAELAGPATAEIIPIRPAIFPSLFATQEYPVHRANFAISAAIHLAAIALLCTSGIWIATHQLVAKQSTAVATDIAPYLPPAATLSHGGGGGGDRDKLGATKGNAPRFAREQLTPPAIVVRNNDPKLPEEATVVGPPNVALSKLNNIGDPLSRILGSPSNGTGVGGGIGSAAGGGIGSGYGTGIGPGRGGGIGGGLYRVGNGVSAPRALFDPEPEYTDEARKAKMQGVVVLALIVAPDGRARDIRVARSLGMGLDEKAIEAVRKWKFDPARRDGQPVSVQISVEVNFHLY